MIAAIDQIYLNGFTAGFRYIQTKGWTRPLRIDYSSGSNPFVRGKRDAMLAAFGL